MTNRTDAEYEIDLLKLGKALWHFAWLLVVAMLIGGAVFFAYTKIVITPLYDASAMLYVNNSSVSLGSTKVSITSGDLTAQEGLIDTYSVILKSRNTLDTVIEKANLSYEYGELVEKISAGSVNGTGVLRITVTDEDPAMAAMITNTIVDILPDRITKIVEGSSVEVVDRAVVPEHPVSPSVLRNTGIGILLGLVISAALVILWTLMDTTIRGEDFLLENFADIPVLATIPDLTDTKSKGYYYASSSGSKQNKKRGAAV